MAEKKLNSAQALLAHIGLKTEPLKLFGAKILVRQWTASERIKYMKLITDSKDYEGDEICLVRPQAQIVALSLVDDSGKPLFSVTWEGDKPTFADPDGVESLVQNRTEEASEAFIVVSEFNGVLFSQPQPEGEVQEDVAVKN